MKWLFFTALLLAPVLGYKVHVDREREGAALGEERTKLLEEMLTNKAKAGSALDQPGKPNSSGEFFNRSVVKRWDDVAARYKPVLNQRLVLLRNAERAWNGQLGEHAFPEEY